MFVFDHPRTMCEHRAAENGPNHPTLYQIAPLATLFPSVRAADSTPLGQFGRRLSKGWRWRLNGMITSFIVHYLAIQKFFSSHTLLLRLEFDAFRVLPSELRPTAVDGKFRACREGRVEREEEDGLSNFLRRPEALHRIGFAHLPSDLGGHVFIGKRFADDRRVDGTGRHRVDSNLPRKQLSGEHPSE